MECAPLESNEKSGIPMPSLRRLPCYYRRLLQAIEEGMPSISSEELGKSANVPGAHVRRDLGYVLSQPGRPGVGYDVRWLAAQLQEFLGLVNVKEAVLAGAGNLGRALAMYPGFSTYGLRIIALFDSDPLKVGQFVGDREVLPASKLTGLVRRLNVLMGIITVPAGAAQSVTESMVAGGIKFIWNFAPTRLVVPDGVLIKNEDLAGELATVSHYIARLRQRAESESW